MGSLIDPTSVTTALDGIEFINSIEGFINSWIGKAKIINSQFFKIL